MSVVRILLASAGPGMKRAKHTEHSDLPFASLTTRTFQRR